MCTATVNPDRAQGALNRLIEETFPEVGKDRERAVEKALEIMDKEKDRAYSVSKMGESTRSGPWGRAQDILKNRRRRGH